jgi:hypothetical protein
LRTATSPRGSQDFWLSSLVGRLAFAAIAAALAVTSVVLFARSNGSSSAHNSNGTPASYGGLPSWLPEPAIPVGRIVTASAGHPWLAVEGDTVSVYLARGHVLATAVGPAVPEEGQVPVPPASPCTFTVTLTRASGAVPVGKAAFTIVDEFGHLHHPQVTGGHGRPPAAAIPPGRTVTLVVKDVLPTGNGQLRWAPQAARPIVSWDFDVEID